MKYEGDHVPGSPYTLKVAGAPDPSKVLLAPAITILNIGCLDRFLNPRNEIF